VYGGRSAPSCRNRSGENRDTERRQRQEKGYAREVARLARTTGSYIHDLGATGRCGPACPRGCHAVVVQRPPVPSGDHSHCVWLYHRFPLSLRDVQEMMAERGVMVSYESVHQWCRKFGQSFANGLRRRRAPPGDKWHLDEVFIKIAGKTHYLWRAVDQHGNVLDILVTSRRDAKAATRFFRKLLKGLRYVPRVLVTDKPGITRPRGAG